MGFLPSPVKKENPAQTQPRGFPTLAQRRQCLIYLGLLNAVVESLHLVSDLLLY